MEWLRGLGRDLHALFIRIPALAQWATINIGKSIAASVILSLLSTYATALFAARHGFRIPIEGVPLLHVAIAFATFGVFFGSVATLLVIVLMIRYIEEVFRGSAERVLNLMQSIRWGLAPVQWIIRRFRTGEPPDFGIIDEMEEIFRAAFNMQIPSVFGSMIALYLAAACFAVFILELFQFDTIATIVTGLHLSDTLNMSAYTPRVGAMWSLGLSILLVATWCAGRRASWIMAQFIASCMILIVLACSLVIDDLYGSFLRIIRFGGGIEVQITLKDKADEPPASDQYLILTTNEVAIVYDDKAKLIRTIKLDDIRSEAFALHPRWLLPAPGLARQADYIDLRALDTTPP